MKRPTLTPVSLIKKVFRPGERSLPRNEVIERLGESGLVDGQAALRLVDEVLARPDSPVKTGHTEAILELKHKPHHLFDLAYRLLRDTRAPRNADHILREIRRQTNLSWNQASRMLALERDPRFVQYEGDDRWYLAEWNLANDELYRFAQSRGIDRLTLRTLPYVIEQELQLNGKQTLFVPELDDRFQVDGDTLYIIPANGGEPHQQMEQITMLDDEELDHKTAEAAQADAGEPHLPSAEKAETRLEEADGAEAEVAAAAACPLPEERIEQLTMEEEPVMNAMNATQTVEKSDVLKEVEQLLNQALAKLEGRQQEMSREVVVHFQESDMSAIESLMQEKHRNEQVASGIRQVLAGMDRK